MKAASSSVAGRSRDAQDRNPSTGNTTSTSDSDSDDSPRIRIVSREMARYCFEVLNATLWKKRLPIAPKFTNDAYPLFVTWNKGKSQGLRGCIGTFKPLPLREGLRDYAIQSAFKDTRFKPITIDELDQLHVSISILHDFEEGDDWEDWTVGVHGIRIFFDDGYGSKTATFLPDVASSQGWNKRQTINALLKKGGFIGPITEEAREGITQLTRYKSDKITMSYDQYIKYELDTPPVSRRNSTRLA